MTKTANKYHRNHTITYWSVYTQSWVRGASSVPDCELAAMTETERARVARHLAK